MKKLLVTCPHGLEEITAKQISQLSNNKIKINRGGVSLEASTSLMYQINLHVRTAMHVLWEVANINAKNYDELHEQLIEIPWEFYMHSKQTFMIKTKSFSKIFENPSFSTLKVKDSIVDRFKKKHNKRPSANKIKPDIVFVVIIVENNIRVFLDSSGTPLYKRGYKTKMHVASLNECLAAGLILLTNWDGKSPFYDPMCGSGTIPIEAMLIARKIPPGIFRRKFGFMNWIDYNEDLWRDIRLKSQKNVIKIDNGLINGTDLLQNNIEVCHASASKIKCEQYITFKKMDLNDFYPKSKTGIILMNPPYGLRLESANNIEEFYIDIGNVLKQRCSGHDGYIFTANLKASKCVGLKSKSRSIIQNGKLDCRLIHYPLVKGNY